MKGRMLTVFVVLAMATAACAEPGVVGGDDVNQESESVTNDAVASDDTSGSEGTTVEESEPASAETPTAQKPTEKQPASDDQKTSTTESPLVTNPPKETPSTTTTTKPAEGNPGVDPGLLPLFDQAKADLAERLGVGIGSISVISAELVEWPDTSLGCPQPDMVYAQIPTDGSLIVLSHGGSEYRYHTGGAIYIPFLCE